MSRYAQSVWVPLLRIPRCKVLLRRRRVGGGAISKADNMVGRDADVARRRAEYQTPSLTGGLPRSRTDRRPVASIDEDLPSLEALAEKVNKTNDEKQFLKVSVTLQLHVRRTETAEHLSLDEVASIIKRISTAVHVASSDDLYFTTSDLRIGEFVL